MLVDGRFRSSLNESEVAGFQTVGKDDRTPTSVSHVQSDAGQDTFRWNCPSEHSSGCNEPRVAGEPHPVCSSDSTRPSP